jgi:hypothetical protein
MAFWQLSEGVAPAVSRAYNELMRVRVHFERTGGITGRKIEVFVDSDSLPPTQAKRLHTLLAQSRFFDLPLDMRSSPGGADRFLYRVTVEADSRTRTVEAGGAAVPANMWPLLDWLTRRET